MRKIAIFSVFIFICVSANAEFGDINLSGLKGAQTAGIPIPKPAAERPSRSENGIKVYGTDEEFPFESRAEAAMRERIAAIQKAGVTTLGGTVMQKENRDYTFVIEYLPEVERESLLPPALLIQNYENGKTYWRKSEAEAEMNFVKGNFMNAGVPIVSFWLYEKNRGNAFAVDYVAENFMRYSRTFEAAFRVYSAGNFTFESQAERAIGEFMTSLERAGIPVIRGKAVEKQNGDYAVEIEYVVKTCKYGDRPKISVGRYKGREIFPFESRALEAARKRTVVFSEAKVFPLSAMSRETGNDFSFDIDYLVEKIYHYDGVKPSATVKTYQSPAVFDFEREAEEAMEEKTEYFNSAGMTVVGRQVTEIGKDYSFVLDYIHKENR